MVDERQATTHPAGCDPGATTWPRVLPGTYRVRLTKNGKVYETPLRVDLDPRAAYTRSTIARRSSRRRCAYTRCSSACPSPERIVALREQAAAKAAALAEGERAKKRLLQLVTRIEDVRRQIVATKEGGAVTGEERLREHLDSLYGAIVGWEGRPAPISCSASTRSTQARRSRGRIRQAAGARGPSTRRGAGGDRCWRRRRESRRRPLNRAR